MKQNQKIGGSGFPPRQVRLSLQDEWGGWKLRSHSFLEIRAVLCGIVQPPCGMKTPFVSFWSGLSCTRWRKGSWSDLNCTSRCCQSPETTSRPLRRQRLARSQRGAGALTTPRSSSTKGYVTSHPSNPPNTVEDEQSITLGAPLQQEDRSCGQAGERNGNAPNITTYTEQSSALCRLLNTEERIYFSNITLTRKIGRVPNGSWFVERQRSKV